MAPPAPTEISEVTRDAHDTLEAALSVFDGPDSTTRPTGGRQQLRDLAEKHKQAAAKAVLLVSGTSSLGSSSVPPSVTTAELRGVLASLEQSSIALCSCCHGFTAGSGPSLKQSLRQLCGSVVAPTRELVNKLAEAGAGANADAEGLRRVFGRVWSACDELARAPTDNKSTLFRQLADVMAGVKGAARELDELCDASRQELGLGMSAKAAYGATCGAITEGAAKGASASASPSPSCGDGEEEREAGEGEELADEEDDSDDFRDMGSLSAEELRTAEAGGTLLAAAQSVLRLISRPLLEGPPLDPSSPALEQWESLAWHAGKLRSSCEALVAGLYPPHDELDELAGESEAVANTLEVMLGELPESYFEVQGEGEGAEAVAGQQQRFSELQLLVAAAQREVEAAAGRMADELSRRGRPGGGA